MDRELKAIKKVSKKFVNKYVKKLKKQAEADAKKGKCLEISPPDLDNKKWMCNFVKGHKLNHDWEGLSSDSSQRYFPAEVGHWEEYKEPNYTVDSIGNHYRDGKEIEVE